MPKHSSYKTFTRPVSVELANGDTLTIEYAPSHLCPDFWNELVTEEDKPGSTETRADDAFFLSKVAVRWDWLDDKDKPIPITIEFLRAGDNVSSEDLRAMVTAIMNAQNPTRNGTGASEATPPTNSGDASVTTDTAATLAN